MLALKLDQDNVDQRVFFIRAGIWELTPLNPRKSSQDFYHVSSDQKLHNWPDADDRDVLHSIILYGFQAQIVLLLSEFICEYSLRAALKILLSMYRSDH